MDKIHEELRAMLRIVQDMGADKAPKQMLPHLPPEERIYNEFARMHEIIYNLCVLVEVMDPYLLDGFHKDFEVPVIKLMSRLRFYLGIPRVKAPWDDMGEK